MQPMNQEMIQAKVQEDRYSYLMMFCALLMVRKSRASMDSAMELVPLSPRVSDLAGELIHSQRNAADPTSPSGRN